MSDILDQPFVPVGGQVREGGSICLYMHRGYDRLIGGADVHAARAWDICREAGLVYLVWGSRDNPLFSWPVYAVRRPR